MLGQEHFCPCALDEENANVINEAKVNGGRVICVGTTSVRTLESCYDGESLKKSTGDTYIIKL